LYLRNYLRQFARDVRAQKLRLFLTIFGIVWGTAAVTLMLAFGQGLHKQIVVNQKGLGDAIVIAWPTRTSKPWQGLPRGRVIRLTDDDIAFIRAEVPEIDRLSEEYEENARLTWGAKTLAASTSGANAEWGVMRNMIPSAGGRFFNELDLSERRRVVFLGDQLEIDLFGGPGKAVGQTVRLNGAPFTVIGVLQPKAQDSSYGGRDKDKAIIPSTTFKAMFGVKYVDNVIFQVLDPRKVESAKKKFTAAAGSRVQIIGDDYLVTDATRVTQAIADGACNAVLVKPNQAGTVSAARAALDAAKAAGWGTIVSARSGETEDVTIVHLATGWDAGQLKVGSFARSERMAKWNEGLRIEQALGSAARFAGWA